MKSNGIKIWDSFFNVKLDHLLDKRYQQENTALFGKFFEALSNSDEKLERAKAKHIIDTLFKLYSSKIISPTRLVKWGVIVIAKEKYSSLNVAISLHSIIIMKSRNKDIYDTFNIHIERETDRLPTEKKSINSTLSILYFRDNYFSHIDRSSQLYFLSLPEHILKLIFHNGNHSNQRYLLNSLWPQQVIENEDFQLIKKAIACKDKSYREYIDTLSKYRGDGSSIFDGLKIALCVSGQLRGYEKALESWQRCGLLSKNVDVYLSVWDDIGNRKATPGHSHRVFSENFSSLYKELCAGYDYKEILASFPLLDRAIHENSKACFDKLEYLYTPVELKVQNEEDTGINFKNNHERMYYKIEDCYNLIKNPERYDLIIRVRPDKVFNQFERLDWNLINDVCKNGVVLTDLGQVPTINPTVGVVIGDQFAIGAPNSMAIYSSVYSTYSKHTILPMKGHNSVARVLINNNIKIYPFPSNAFGDLLAPIVLSDKQVADLIKIKWDKEVFSSSQVSEIEYFLKLHSSK